MTLLRRSAGLGAVLLSILGLLLCLAGVAGVWTARGRADRLVAASFDTADDAFDFMDTRLTRVRQSLGRSRERAGGLSKLAERLTAAAPDAEADADVPAEGEPLRQAIDAAYRELQSAEQWLDASEAVARGVHRVAESVAASRADASSPESSAGVSAQKVAEFSADVADAIARLEVIRQGLIDLRDKRTLARAFAARTIARVAELDERLANLSARIGAFQSRVAAARGSCAELGRRIQWWVAFAAVVITLVLLWFAASQIGMAVHGWRWLSPRSPHYERGATSRGGP